MFKLPLFKTTKSGLLKVSESFDFISFKGEMTVVDVRRILMENSEFMEEPYFLDTEYVAGAVNDIIRQAMGEGIGNTLVFVPVEKSTYDSLTVEENSEADARWEEIFKKVEMPSPLYSAGRFIYTAVDQKDEFYLFFELHLEDFKAFLDGICS